MRFCHNFYPYLFATSDTSGAMQLNLHYHQSLSLPWHSDRVYTETHATNTQFSHTLELFYSTHLIHTYTPHLLHSLYIFHRQGETGHRATFLSQKQEVGL